MLVELFEGEFPRLSKVNSHVVGSNVFWLQRQGTTQVYVVWNVKTRQKLFACAPRDKAIDVLEIKYNKEEK